VSLFIFCGGGSSLELVSLTWISLLMGKIQGNYVILELISAATRLHLVIYLEFHTWSDQLENKEQGINRENDFV